MEAHRAPVTVPSRVLDNFYWLGRYAERLEDHIRLLRTVLSRLAGEGGPLEEAELDAMVRCLAALEMIPPRFREKAARSELAGTFRTLVYDQNHTGSARQIIRRIGYLTATLRDRWETPGASCTRSPRSFRTRPARPLPCEHPRRAAPARPPARGFQRNGNGKHVAQPRLAVS